MIEKTVAEALELHGIGVLGDDVFIGRMPKSPDRAIVVISSSGGLHSSSHGKLQHVMEWTIDVLIRTTSYEDGISTLFSCVDPIRSLMNTNLNGFFISSCSQLTPPYLADTDDMGRDIFQTSFQVMGEMSF